MKALFLSIPAWVFAIAVVLFMLTFRQVYGDKDAWVFETHATHIFPLKVETGKDSSKFELITIRHRGLSKYRSKSFLDSLKEKKAYVLLHNSHDASDFILLQEVLGKGKDLEYMAGEEFAFNLNPYKPIWLGTIALGTATSIALLWIVSFVLIKLLIPLCIPNFSKRKRWILLCSSMAITMVLIWIVYDISHRKDYFFSGAEIVDHLKFLVDIETFQNLLLTNFLTPSAAVFGIVLIYFGFALQPIEKISFSGLKSIYFLLFYSTTLVMVIGIIANSLLRKVVLTEYVISPTMYKLFPSEFALGYGLILSTFLMIFFMPPFFILESKAPSRSRQTLETSKKDLISVLLGTLAPIVTSGLLEFIVAK